MRMRSAFCWSLAAAAESAAVKSIPTQGYTVPLLGILVYYRMHGGFQAAGSEAHHERRRAARAWAAAAAGGGGGGEW